jgi:hypothetical protein
MGLWFFFLLVFFKQFENDPHILRVATSVSSGVSGSAGGFGNLKDFPPQE